MRTLLIAPGPWQARHAGQEHEFERIAAVQRHLGDAHIIDHLSNAGRTCLDLQRVSLNGHLLVQRAYSE